MQQSPHGKLTATDYALYATVVLLWGAAWLPLRLQLGVVSPEVSAVWRFALGGIVMFVWLLWSGERIRFSLSDHLRFAILGATLCSFNFLFAYYAGYHINAGLLAVMFSLTAVINPFYSALLGRGGLNLCVVIGALLGVTGIALLFGPEIVHADGQARTLLGLLLAFLATFTFATGNMFSAAYQSRGLPVLSANTWAVLYGTGFMVLVALVRGQPFIIEWSARYILSILWMAIPATVIGFFAYVTLIGRIGPGRTGYTTVLMPVVALVLSTIFENYSWTLYAFAGVAMVLIGNVIVLSAPAKA